MKIQRRVRYKMNKAKINEIFKRFVKQNPHPTTELQFKSSFELLIAVILSAQATDVSVNKATQKLFRVARTPKSIYALGEIGLKKYVKIIGLYNTKAKNIIKTCKILIEKHDDKVPHTREELEALPGVGRKTANVILNTAFSQATIAVDTHIFRVANRTGLAKGKTPLIIENKLTQCIPSKYLKNAHHWLILHGRYTCVARKPKCYQCIIEDLCEYTDKTPHESTRS